MTFNIISPHNQQIFKTVQYQSEQVAIIAIESSLKAQKHWKQTPISTRIQIITKFVDCLLAKKEDIITELSYLIGRPRKQNYNEMKGFEFRARYLISIAESSLSDTIVEDTEDFQRFMTREPLGTVFVIGAWNYPYLVAVNALVPALLSGNAVIMKQAPQTFPVADRFHAALDEAGLPKGVFQKLDIDLDVAKLVIQHPNISGVLFTGSVNGGHAVNLLAAQAKKYIHVGLELGGNDPAYVRSDADVKNAAANLVDGACYNSGQSCCGIERIYVHEAVYDEFVEECVKVIKEYVLGDPFKDETNLGPVVNLVQANTIRKHVKDAIKQGAKPLIDESLFAYASESSCYIAPQILVNVNHQMAIMTSETFGPVVGIQKVKSDEEAVQLMNDSEYGLTASIWTSDLVHGHGIARQLETGTVFINRCDYLDPALAWTGVKNSGRGCTLSKYGFDQLTRPKSYHFKKHTS